ncbi:protein PYRICULARIA ORYZAE RESISTANCE 21 [Manihot esculenta]|uniref:Uncharacterized protein n=2 Tax=Manihot esculenta TaxID=3983 RepID=A0ACB7H4M9_MANES|nr:protein PYRICULARIA ORYZAE RESISTANCE 21 [Manihot esculenta]KAG8647527.1 hypothetical protein MANES_09G077766v8 [Manihot esculenta]
MAEKKVTVMVIKVDLGCEKCQKKIKKVLCKIPQIQNQIYDEKANTVTITVVCCSPEKIKKKICCKGGDSVKGIEIKVPEKVKPQEKPKEPEKPKPKEPEKPKEKPKEPEKSKQAEKPKALQLIPDYPPPVRACCMECYQGYGGGPCYHGYGRPLPCYESYGTPVPCYEAYGRPVYDSWVGGGGFNGCRRGCYVGRCDCLSEGNPSACSVM